TSIEDIRSLRLITAVKTPYLPNGQFDLEAYDNLVDMQIANGADGLLSTVLATKLRLSVMPEATAHQRQLRPLRGVGMDTALHINPYYGETSLDGLVAHYNSVLSIGPVIVYNIPSRTAQDIPPSVVQALAQSPNLVGVKEFVGNERIKEYASEGIVVWSANDEECHDARWDCGAVGVQCVEWGRFNQV
ncbi:4-hydroxy-tetrahydrodipicolinate synthase, chloroplastic, partial [Mucuna pruriens]